MDNHKLTSFELNTNILEFLSQGSNKKSLFDLRLYVILNKDGTIRWAIPHGSKSSLFLKTYNPINFRSIFIYNVLWLIHFLGLYKYILKEQYLKVGEGSVLSEFLINNNVLDWSLFFGTAGNNRKVILILKKNTGISFVKIGLNEYSKRSIINEKDALSYLEKYEFKVPRILLYNAKFSALELSDINVKKKDYRVEFTKYHFSFVCKLNEICKINRDLKSTFFYERIQGRIISLDRINSGNRHFESNLVELFQYLVIKHNELSTLTNLHFGPCHGDFTPWNVILNSSDNEIRIMDWEFFDMESPLLYDFFHFKFQAIFLNNGDIRIYKNFLTSLYNDLTTIYSYTINFQLFISYFELYLIDVVSKNLVMFFNSKEVLHLEAKSLILAWRFFLKNDKNIQENL